jgi:CBS domain-containing protein
LSDPQVGLVAGCANGGSMAGVVTKTDIVRQIARGRESASAVNLAQMMTKEVVDCLPDGNLVQGLSKMKHRGLTQIPVIDSSLRPIGVVNARDALRAMLGEVNAAGTLLRHYVMGLGSR